MTLQNLRTMTILGALAVGVAWASHGLAAPAHSNRQPLPIAGGDAYSIKSEVVGECKAGSECTAKITINVTDADHHTNDSFPFKFAAAAPGVEFHGTGGNVFTGKCSSPTADFSCGADHKSATMVVKFKPTAKGPLAITGDLKICVCTDKNCEPTTIKNFKVDVMVK
jgi:hypothetical protein